MKLKWVLLNILSIMIMLRLIDYFTLRKYHMVSGNGNIGLVGIVPFVVLLIPFTYYLVKMAKILKKHSFICIFLIIVTFYSGNILYDYQYRKLLQIREQMLSHHLAFDFVADVTMDLQSTLIPFILITLHFYFLFYRFLPLVHATIQ